MASVVLGIAASNPELLPVAMFGPPDRPAGGEFGSDYFVTEGVSMSSMLASLGLAYLAGSGMTTNAAVVGRGLFRAVRTAVGGEYKTAAVEALGSLAAPALMSYGSIASLCMEVADAAQELAGPALEEAMERREFGRVA